MSLEGVRAFFAARPRTSRCSSSAAAPPRLAELVNAEWVDVCTLPAPVASA